MDDLSQLPTEARNPATEKLDQLTTLELVRVLHIADREAIAAVEAELPRIAMAVDAIVARRLSRTDDCFIWERELRGGSACWTHRSARPPLQYPSRNGPRPDRRRGHRAASLR